jgi:phytoene dehydrogenase-like protein
MLERAYDDWKEGRWSQRPYLDILIPTQIDPTMAPVGKHYMSVFVQYCPYALADGPWTDEKRASFGRTVIDSIAEHSPGFRDLILHAEIRTPADIEREVGLTEGNIFQGELTFDQLLFNRPIPGYAQYRSPIRGLYLCGSSTHPGAGHTGLTCAAYLARSGRRVLVLEAAEQAGGAAGTREFAPGFRASSCAHLLHLMPGWLLEELRLARHGLKMAAERMPTIALSGTTALRIPMDRDPAVQDLAATDAQAFR